MKTKHVVASVLVGIVVLASLSVWLGGGQPMPLVRGWTGLIALAEDAWAYFQPYVGVEHDTGLAHSGLYWPFFTEWDLGAHIQAIMDAERLGFITREGSWGGAERIENLLSFLETRPLTAENVSYLWYDARDGTNSTETLTNPYDSGRLLVALGNLKQYRSELASRIDNIVHNITNYEPSASIVDGWSGSLNIYAYYCAMGYSYFWPTRFEAVAEAILDNIDTAETVETYGVELPKALITCEPLLHAVFELDQDPRLMNVTRQVYLAHQARSEATGNYTAFSEGNTDLSNPSYVYEWVVRPNGSVWLIEDHAGNKADIPSIIYFKIAVGFYALYGSNFSMSMVDYVKDLLPAPTYGYADGIDENDRVVTTEVDKTNAMILSAARYATEHLDLSLFPWPFIYDSTANNTLIVIGESKVHGPVGAAHTIDTLGGMVITGRLARESSSGAVKSGMDGWMATYNPGTGNITLLDKLSNLVLVGSPGINLIGFYYNTTIDLFGDPLPPVLFRINYTGGSNYLYVPSSNSTYPMEFWGGGGLKADYGTIMVFTDHFGRYVAMVYGVGAEGTRVASEVLRDYDLWDLWGRAVIVKYYNDTPEEYPNTITIVEVIP